MTNLEEEKKITRGKMGEPSKPLELICVAPTPAQAWRTLRVAMRGVDLGRLAAAARMHAWRASMHAIELKLDLADGTLADIGPPQTYMGTPFSNRTFTPETHDLTRLGAVPIRDGGCTHWLKPQKTYSRSMFIAAVMCTATFDATNAESVVWPAVLELQRMYERM
jgi:hypothetical protein